ncbi:acyl-[ACP]--phospholipid O-acyltransferase [Paremcibacter congregatus]|uniref:acyl-[ACP]--phospholipid O-acyltransferase n=1 Tax=Paremcibacter congregatus TaxID=2043170 RepID=UPI0019575118|nr:acyl-[ACP]--phospholipid O-acyltransferase [Paremcibacter congregatus]
MSGNLFNLLKTKRFAPLFVTQFMGAFNDNVFKNALVFLVTYKIAVEQGWDNAAVIVPLAGGLFILPFFLFSSLAGQLSDKFEKSRLIRIIKFVEILLMALASYGIYSENVTVMMVTLFMMGAQSAFFGPLKYSILPEHLRQDELIGGNALIEMGTFLSIILGLIVGGMLILVEGGPMIISGVVLSVAVIGFLSSFAIPKTIPADTGLKINFNIIQETAHIIGDSRQDRRIFMSILGISWFWFFGVTFLAQIPTFSREVIGADEGVGTLFNCAFSIGIGIGSFLCDRLLKGRVQATYVPLAAIFMTLFSVDIYYASQGYMGPAGGDLITVGEFIKSVGNIRILLDMMFIAISGGVYIVPLYAIIQDRAAPCKRSRMIASTNIINSLFMAVSAGGSAVLISNGVTIPQVFLITALLNAFVAVYICRLLPEELIRSIARAILRLLYRVEVHGLDHYDWAGKKAVIVANHTSFLDGALLGAFLPDKMTFAINTHIAERWWVKPAFAFINLLPLDPTNPMAAKTMVGEVKKGRKLVIFPEGRLTVTGALMKIYEGPGTIAHLADAPILPVRIEGAQFSHFSRLRGKLRLRLFPKIIITVLEPVNMVLPPEVSGKERRRLLGEKLYTVMSDMMFQTSDRHKTLYQALLDARNTHGGGHLVLEDVERTPLSYNKLMLGTIVLGRAMARLTACEEKVGLLLPNTNGCVVTFFGLQLHGRVPAMLNYSTGVANIRAACKAAGIRNVMTSRRFIEVGGLGDIIDGLTGQVAFTYLEDLRAEIGFVAKLHGVVAARFPGAYYRRRRGGKDPQATAVVLFTSGSEGVPKGVALSHVNLQSNRYQLAARVDFNPADVVFNALPIFHCFGMTGGLLLPLLAGIRTFLYPSPLHYKIVPELVYDTNATIMFGTDTFLNGYARFAHAYDFYSMRYIFAGAERLKPETKLAWAEKFGVRLFEGYGATETSPVLACNTPMHSRAGTVGQLLPDVEYRLEPVPGIDAGGKLLVRGPNVMKGYLLYDNPGVLVPPENGWYDTGDIVEIDGEGYVAIKGRAKRFAKLAGEMVSLTAVEAVVAALWPDNLHGAVALPDEKKGEQIILLTDGKAVTKEAISKKIKADGLQDLMLPKMIMTVENFPVLGTGKIDYVEVGRVVAQKLEGKLL